MGGCLSCGLLGVKVRRLRRKKSHTKGKDHDNGKTINARDGFEATTRSLEPGAVQNSGVVMERGWRVASPDFGQRSKTSDASSGRILESIVSSDGEYFDCFSDFVDCSGDVHQDQILTGESTQRSNPAMVTEDVGEPVHSLQELSLPQSPNGKPSFWEFLARRARSIATGLGEVPQSPEKGKTEILEEFTAEPDVESASTSSVAGDDGTAQPRLAACLSILRGSSQALSQKALRDRKNRKWRYLGKPVAGSSLRRLDAQEDKLLAKECWEPGDPTTFKIRSQNYLKTKIKENSTESFYDLFAVDMFSFERKEHHIARRIQVPLDPYKRTEAELAAMHEAGIPALLIINLQLPNYQASLFGNNDGPGHSLVYYYALREGFNPSTVENPVALGLLQRFIHNSREENSEPTRNRLKLIPRVVNVEEWTGKAPLSKAEAMLVSNYNNKPLLTRPQQTFYHGPNYFEVDLDVHGYAYLARRVFNSVYGRLNTLVFENAFVLQGNRPEELPEQLLGVSRLYRVDFTRMRPFWEIVQEASKAPTSMDEQDGRVTPRGETAQGPQSSGT